MRNQSSYISQKENRISLQRRLSLKYSSSVSNKNNPRLSIPMRRDSMATSCNISTFNPHNQAVLKQHRQSLVSNASTVSRNNKKQTILTNLLKKLDSQEELRDIIQSKIKNCIQGQCSSFMKTQANQLLQERLKGCQSEMQCFKQLVRELMNKIKVLQSQKIKRTTSPQTIQRQQTPSFNRKKKSYKQSGVQTDSSYTKNHDDSIDFMQNLDKTLKVLSGKKIR